MEKSFTLSILLKKSIDTFCASLLFLPESKAKVCYLCFYASQGNEWPPTFKLTRQQLQMLQYITLDIQYILVDLFIENRSVRSRLCTCFLTSAKCSVNRVANLPP